MDAGGIPMGASGIPMGASGIPVGASGIPIDASEIPRQTPGAPVRLLRYQVKLFDFSGRAKTSRLLFAKILPSRWEGENLANSFREDFAPRKRNANI